MEKRGILLSAVRYLQAVYDIDLETNDKDLVNKVLEQVIELDDSVLLDYWRSYRESSSSDESREVEDYMTAEVTVIASESSDF
ncbi:MAG: hypothetical protein ACRBHB_09400 [Arenicella sp.]